MTAFTAILQVSAAGSPSNTSAGSGYATDAVAVCVLGGTRLGGGRGYISGAVMGTLIIAVISNMTRLMNAPQYMNETCKGAVIIGAMLLHRKNIDRAAI